MFAIEPKSTVPKKGGDKITEKQRVFAEAYIKSGDAALSYSEAYGTKNAHTALEKGTLLLKKPEIKEFVEKNSVKEGLEQEKVLELLYAIAFTSPADFVRIETEGGKQKIVWQDIDSLPDAAKKAICAIKNTPSGICIETLDRMKAIDMLMKYSDLKRDGGVGVIIEGNVE